MVEPSRGGSQDGNELLLLGFGSLMVKGSRRVDAPSLSLDSYDLAITSLAFGGAVSTYESSHRIFKVPMITPKRELLRLVDPSPTLFGLARNGGTQKAKVLASKVQIFCIFVLALKVSNCKFLVTRCWP